VIGALIGLVNGILITRVGISSFIATIGIGSVLAGISIYLTRGTVLIQGIPRGLQTFAQSNTAGIPNVVWLAAVITLIFWITFEQTPYGRKLLAIGLSRRSADLLGMRVERPAHQFLCHLRDAVRGGRGRRAGPGRLGQLGGRAILPAAGRRRGIPGRHHDQGRAVQRPGHRGWR